MCEKSWSRINDRQYTTGSTYLKNTKQEKKHTHILYLGIIYLIEEERERECCSQPDEVKKWRGTTITITVDFLSKLCRHEGSEDISSTLLRTKRRYNLLAQNTMHSEYIFLKLKEKLKNSSNKI